MSILKRETTEIITAAWSISILKSIKNLQPTSLHIKYRTRFLLLRKTNLQINRVNNSAKTSN